MIARLKREEIELLGGPLDGKRISVEEIPKALSFRDAFGMRHRYRFVWDRLVHQCQPDEDEEDWGVEDEDYDDSFYDFEDYEDDSGS